MKEDGDMIWDEEEIRKEAHKYFSNFYFADRGIDCESQKWVLQHIVHRLIEEAIRSINASVSKEEVITTLRSFAHDKCHGPNGWPTEFYFH